ncbi:uncharacterized protein LOC117253042 isoform X2 [Epinephelus lanceolatus]|uniref:uncharacterized protein LOC117253042 isoform X2 n=1 Tax=Epinephelus lanceolatus TaxID=310571 RepID=UPI0014471002|nr:uncharacterized protein LOC117253042 isoform X2 [Epinephelus lanceolatus]
MLQDRSGTSGAEWGSYYSECDNPQKEAGSDSIKNEAGNLSLRSSQETSTEETDESTCSALILERSPQSSISPHPTRRMIPSFWTLNSKQDKPSLTLNEGAGQAYQDSSSLSLLQSAGSYFTTGGCQT